MNRLSPEYELDRDDRRNERRRRVLSFGKLSEKTGAQLVECAISNVSAHGAEIRLYTDYSFPDHVFLIDAKMNLAHSAEIVWRRGQRWGLNFAETHDLEKYVPANLQF